MMVKGNTDETRPAPGSAAPHMDAVATRIEKMREVGLVAIVGAFLLSAMGYLALCALDPALAPPQILVLEKRYIAEFPECSLAALATGEFQDSFEEAASDHVPARDGLLQANAAVQRLGVRTANLPFGYAAIPTYYGSGYAEIPKAQIVQEIPAATSKKTKATLAENAEALNAVAEKIDGDLVYYRPARLDVSSVSPVSDLVKNTANEDYTREKFLDKLDGRWQVFADEYSSLEDYEKDFYRTDHHWKIGAAVKGYGQIMEALGREALSFSEPKDIGWGAWYGASSRVGVDFDVAAEEVQDVDYERSELKVAIDDKEVEESALDRGYRAADAQSYAPKESYGNHYGLWFHMDYGLITIENPSCENDETLLIIADSYSNCIERFFAESYARVVVVDPRHLKESFSTLVDEEKPSDLVCILSDQTVTSTTTTKTLTS